MADGASGAVKPLSKQFDGGLTEVRRRFDGICDVKGFTVGQFVDICRALTALRRRFDGVVGLFLVVGNVSQSRPLENRGFLEVAITADSMSALIVLG